MNLNLISNRNERVSIPLPDYNEATQTMAEYNENLTRRIVNKNDNPNPIIIISLVMIIIIMMYIFYIMFIKRNLSGEWFSNSKKINIFHNKWTDKISFSNNYDIVGNNYGIVAGNAVFVTDKLGEKKMAVFNPKTNCLYWYNSADIWTRAHIIV